MAIVPVLPMIPLMFRFSHQFQIVAGDLNGVIVQNRFTAVDHAQALDLTYL
uniref:Uncharacterized protein n=1 Tax=Rhizobium rhizogenes TaxID=359 RepID=A0A7S4ZSX8_RHIRH|nr:hypothetical protein pC5.7c_563 [Rhizobium rhizogenes]QCL09599.1 hypothetical protein pC5.8a_107 [Rhizobium rhizogenes]